MSAQWLSNHDSSNHDNSIMTTAPWGMYIACQQQLPAKLLGQSAVDKYPAAPVVAGRSASGQVQDWYTLQKHPVAPM